MWVQLNTFYHRMGALGPDDMLPGSLSRLLTGIKEACQTFTGIKGDPRGRPPRISRFPASLPDRDHRPAFRRFFWPSARFRCLAPGRCGLAPCAGAANSLLTVLA